MEQLLSYPFDWLKQHKAGCTVEEICQQPQLWEQQWQALVDNGNTWQPFLSPLLDDPQLQVVLTGAGSSAFVGKTLAPWLREKTGRHVYAYATTDIVSTPLQYLDKSRKTLLVSFARSGNSPESLAAIKIADQIVDDCYHLMVTCNPDSKLVNYAKGRSNVCSLIMPRGSHDRGFAMTSSFSCMMLTTLLLLGFDNIEKTKSSLAETINVAQKCLMLWQPLTKELAKEPVKRIVYVGSGCFTGLAEEAALKVLELTAGSIATRFDSSLGLRHGPKFTINKETLVVCLLSNNAYTRQYDKDLFNEIKRDGQARRLVGLSGIASSDSDMLSVNSQLDDIWLVFPYLLFAQMLGVEASLALGSTPDNPCPTGEVNRVVQGVTIYPFNNQANQNGG